jgi:hypothetical protein
VSLSLSCGDCCIVPNLCSLRGSVLVGSGYQTVLSPEDSVTHSLTYSLTHLFISLFAKWKDLGKQVI